VRPERKEVPETRQFPSNESPNVRIGSDPPFHLTYCTNIHPGETWSEVAEALEQYLPPLKTALSPSAPFGVGLRLSDRAGRELLRADRLGRFRAWLDAQGLYVFTLNGFPHGRFHGETVKAQVHDPDWRTDERVAYTRRLARILAALLPEGLTGSISTSPLAYAPGLSADEREEVLRAGSRHLAEVAATLARIEDETGTCVHVDLEPEPDAVLETTEESVAFFEDWLWPVGGDHLAETLGVSMEEAQSLLRRHVQLCYDTCHFAVEYEGPETAFERFRDAGISIGKVQLSAALRVPLSPDNRTAVRERLRPFAEDTYLHQVVERRGDGTFRAYRDLPDALPHVDDEAAREWRIHYHVPLFTDAYEGLETTRGHVPRTLDILTDDPVCTHLEMETYTWDVLPSARKTDLATSLRREYEWVQSEFAELTTTAP